MLPVLFFVIDELIVTLAYMSNRFHSLIRPSLLVSSAFGRPYVPPLNGAQLCPERKMRRMSTCPWNLSSVSALNRSELLNCISWDIQYVIVLLLKPADLSGTETVVNSWTVLALTVNVIVLLLKLADRISGTEIVGNYWAVSAVTSNNNCPASETCRP